MLLNKNYSHKIGKKHRSPQQIDAYYPLLVSTLEEIAPATREQLSAWKFFAQQIEYSEHKIFAPLVLFSQDTLHYQPCLKGKEKLPFFAKKQRLAQAQSRLLKKNDQNLRTYLGEHQAFSSFPLDANMQVLCDLFVSKNLRKHTPQLVYRDAVYKTPVHAEQIVRKTEQHPLLQIKCFVEAKGEVLTLVVDDLTTFFFDVAVLVHQNDKRYKKFIGKNLILPIINKKIPILGADGVDTLTNNGIIRINPLISPQHLQKVKELGLPIDEQILDDEGNLCKDLLQKAVVSNEKKSELVEVKYNILQNIDNIILGLREIGNLAEESMQMQKVPYSVLSGSRLIKKIIPQLTLDYSDIATDFSAWMEENYGAEIATHISSGENKILAEVNNPFGNYFAYMQDQLVLSAKTLVSGSSRLPFLLASLLLEHKISSKLAFNDLIDLCFLLSLQELAQVAKAFGDQKGFLEQLEAFKYASEEEQIALLLDLENQHPGIKLSPDQLSLLLDASLLLPQKPLTLGVWDEQVLDAFSLSLARDKLQKPFVLSLHQSPQIKTLLLLIDFLRGENARYQFVDLDFSFAQHLWTDKNLARAEHYGQDTLFWLFAQNLKPDQEKLDQTYDYFTHLRNLFKWLYEHNAFESSNAGATAMDLWIFEQFTELSETFKKDQKIGLSSAFIQGVQHFTKTDFSRYLECIKKLDTNGDYHIAGTIFLQLLDLLAPYVPQMRGQILQYVGEFAKMHSDIDLSMPKDFKIYKLFDLIHKISEKKAQLKLKKHQKIVLLHKGSLETFNLLTENLAVLSSLLSVDQILMSERNEPFPSNFSTFSLLDGELGVADATTEGKKDELSLLEKEYRDKQTYLQTIKEVLIMLNNAPFADPLKIEEKEDEYAMLKDQLLTLEIRIQKLKMQKKS